MKIQDFLRFIKEYLEVENSELTVNTILSNLSEYDSMGKMSMISLLDDKFGISISAAELSQVKTIRDLINFIGQEKFEE